MTLIASIEGYASVFNTPDLNGDIIAPGAFAKSLKKNPDIRMLYQHAAEAPIGRWISFREDRYGLFVKGELILSSPRASEVHALLGGRALDGLSIGYQTARAIRTKTGRRILEADLWEVSIVTFPMAPEARITRVGAAQREFEPQDYAHLFTQPHVRRRAHQESARASSSRLPQEARANRRALVPPPPAQGTSARRLAGAVTSAAKDLSAKLSV